MMYLNAARGIARNAAETNTSGLRADARDGPARFYP
jgi:hypothetical protein